MARPSAQQSDKPLSRRVLVTIDRDMTAKTPKIVWKHEIAVIEAVYGEGKVTEIASASLDEGYTSKISPSLLPFNKTQDTPPRPSDSLGLGFVFIGDPRAEYDRLAACYGKLNDKDILAVEDVYGRFQSEQFTRLVSGATLEDLPDAQLRSLAESYGIAPTGAHRDMSDEQKTVAAAERTAFLKADRATLIKLCADGGVELG